MIDIRTGPVILVDDDDAIRAAVAQSLDLAGFSVSSFASAGAALDTLAADFPGVVVTDIRMPEIDGLQLFASIRKIGPGIPVILMTGHGDVPMAVRALRDGAHDFIAKPFSTHHLIASIERGLERRQLELENRRLRADAAMAERQSPLIGETATIVRLRESLSQIAEADVSVLIEGETGVGKALFAQLLHRASSRRRFKLINVDCAVLSPETAMEQVFGRGEGHKPTTTEAKAALANRGTLFLRSVDRLHRDVQATFLEAIEGQALVGNQRSAYPVDVRIMAAARTDLGDAVSKGQFAEDLYYALNVIRVHIPPLRERQADIPLLFVHFLDEAARHLKREAPPLSDGQRQYLFEHEWPGNVRELRSFAFRVCTGIESEQGRSEAAPDLSLAERVSRFEASIIRSSLVESGGNASLAMAKLKTPRKTFYDKIARHGIDTSSYRKKELTAL